MNELCIRKYKDFIFTQTIKNKFVRILRKTNWETKNLQNYFLCKFKLLNVQGRRK